MGGGIQTYKNSIALLVVSLCYWLMLYCIVGWFVLLMAIPSYCWWLFPFANWCSFTLFGHYSNIGIMRNCVCWNFITLQLKNLKKLMCNWVATILWKYEELKIGRMYALYIQFGQPCLTLLESYTRVTYDIYNTIGINETLINSFFATILQLLYWIFMQLPNY